MVHRNILINSHIIVTLMLMNMNEIMCTNVIKRPRPAVVEFPVTMVTVLYNVFIAMRLSHKRPYALRIFSRAHLHLWL